MVGDLTEGPSANKRISVSFVFEDQCPYYMAMGMSYELYWEGPAEAVKAFRKADRLKQERENVNAWLQGAYIYKVMEDLACVYNPFSKGRPKGYVKEPFDLFGASQKAEKALTDEERILKGRAAMEAFAISFNQSFEAKSKAKGSETDANG